MTLDNLDPLLDALADKVVERLAQRLGVGQPTADVPATDRLLDVHAAAALLGVTPRWLYRKANRTAKQPGLPFTRKLSSGVLRFSEAGIREYMATGKRAA